MTIEEKIILYQEALRTDNKPKINLLYEEICNDYNPIYYIQNWYLKYKNLYDSQEDFIQDYMYLFTFALSKWKPRAERKESKYGGSGVFQNYFWSIVQNHYRNLIKSASTPKRCEAILCPICEQWVHSLERHLIVSHIDLLEDRLRYRKDFFTCDLCNSYKLPKKYEESNLKEIYLNHFKAHHLGILFEIFYEKFPDYKEKVKGHRSTYILDEDGTEHSVYDLIEDNSKLSNLLSLKLTDIQKNIIYEILSGKKKTNYDKDIYPCSKQEYVQELENLKNLMGALGIE